MGLAWSGSEMYLTFGNNNNKLIEAQLNETEAHTMVNVNEVLLLPKETKLACIKFETWKGKVPNLKHKPALITTAPAFQDVGIEIDEVTEQAHHNNMQVRVTNTSCEGVTLTSFAPVAKLQLISAILPERDNEQCFDKTDNTSEHEKHAETEPKSAMKDGEPIQYNLSLIHI